MSNISQADASKARFMMAVDEFESEAVGYWIRVLADQYGLSMADRKRLFAAQGYVTTLPRIKVATILGDALCEATACIESAMEVHVVRPREGERNLWTLEQALLQRAKRRAEQRFKCFLIHMSYVTHAEFLPASHSRSAVVAFRCEDNNRYNFIVRKDTPVTEGECVVEGFPGQRLCDAIASPGFKYLTS